MDETLEAWLTLSLTRGLGGEGARKLLRTLGSPEAVLDAPPGALRELVRPSLAEALKRPPDSAKLAEIAAWLEDANNHIVTLADENYPQSLLNIPDPPLLLYVKGQLALLNQPTIAVVGSRNATAQGKQNAEAFSRAMSDAGLCVVSGLAHGIDAAAHRGALARQGGSIGVIGTGLDKVYPAAHRDLAHTMAAQGALVSEFPLGTPPLAANFPRRNRIISGLSLGCLIVEAGLQSGSLITARLALEQGREVFAIPGSIHSPQSRGCHALIKQGAKLVETAQDVLDEIGGFSTVVRPAGEGATEDKLLDLLGFDPVDVDTLAQRAGLTMADLSAMLLTLELGGRVAVLSGGLYQRIH